MKNIINYINESILSNAGVGITTKIDDWIAEYESLLGTYNSMHRKGTNVYFEPNDRVYIDYNRYKEPRYFIVPDYIHFVDTEEIDFVIAGGVPTWDNMPKKMHSVFLYHIPKNFDVILTKGLRIVDNCMALMSFATPLKATILNEQVYIHIDNLYSIRMFEQWEIDCPNIKEELRLFIDKGNAYKEVANKWEYKKYPHNEPLPDKEQERLNKIFKNFPQDISVYLGHGLLLCRYPDGIWKKS